MMPGAKYISWKLTADGDKLPVDPSTGAVCDAHNREIWRDRSQITGPLAFVLADDDPYACIDIDHCISPSGQWSQTARQVAALFPGAYIEYSPSGTGLHVWLTVPAAVAHCCRSPSEPELELYTEKRFITITEKVARPGSWEYSPPPVVWQAFIDNYFPPGAGTGSTVPGEWTSEPRPDWSGPEEDTELIERMLKSRSARAAVTGGVTIRDLWEANPDALSRAYPDVEGRQGRAFDWSKADAALCQHLAFWTGGNCERIERLFNQSSLTRDKWTSRPEYRQGTILRAITLCQSVYKQPGSQAPAPPATPTPPGAGGIREGLQYLDVSAQIDLFAGCVYVRDLHRIFTPDGGMLRQDQFRATYGGYLFALDSLSDKVTRSAWEAFTESQAYNFPKVNGAVFRPEEPPGAIVDISGVPHVNTYVPVSTPVSNADVKPFTDLIRLLLPDPQDQAILLAYMAAAVQHIGVKFQWCPLIQGVQGNGKSFIGECLVQAIGEKYSHLPDSKDLSNKFNSWISGNLLIVIEEVYTRDRIDVIETLKWMVTNRRVPIQGKGVDQVTGDNRANFIMFSNHRDAIVKTKDDRRFSVFYTAQQRPQDIAASRMDGDYFPNLYEWARNGGYAAINGYLREYQIPAELNPAGRCHRAPRTSSTDAAIANSVGPVEALIREAIEEGRPGFRKGWLSSIAFRKLLDDNRMRVPIRKWSEIIEDMEYLPHPILNSGRVNVAVPFEQGKPRLYIKPGHLSANVEDAATVRAMYIAAQGYLDVDAGIATGNAAI